jgi:predicted GNAT superfamily acetyltransferase
MTLEVAAEAGDAALRAELAAGIRIREPGELSGLEAIRKLFEQIWQPHPTNPPVTLELLRALTKAGNYASGAYDTVTGELVGACIGFFGPPADRVLHSHIAGVSAAGLGRSVGFALKLHQRAWCLRRDVAEIHWTYDPQIRRNAYFNLVKLGARPTEYLQNFYGEMHDQINGSTESDRVLVRWELRSPLVVAACAGKAVPASAAGEQSRGARIALAIGDDGWPVPDPVGINGTTESCLPGPGGGRPARTLLVAVPADIEGLRVTDPDCAVAWQVALRDALAPALARGARVTGFDKDGWYVLSPKPEGKAR